MVRRYPLYSQADTALWMLGDVFEKSERKDMSGFYYAQIVRNYPLSSHAADAKAKLVAFKMPVPQPDPKAVEWMTAEQNVSRPRENLLHKSKGMLHSGPDVHSAANFGHPNLVPEAEADANTDTLKGGGTTALALGKGPGSNAVVDTVQPGQPAPAGSTPATTEDVNTPATDPTTPAADATATPAATDPAAGTANSAASTDSSSPTDPSAGQPDASKSEASASTAANNKKESSSKKKGMKKLMPW
jgi:hypothetical protein